MELELTPEELQLRDELEKRLSLLSDDMTPDSYTKQREAMRDLAMRLHRSLRERGHEPAHHRYMIENRGVPPEHPKFYLHVHPIQDLIAFTHDPHANDDPDDVTLNEDFTLRVYSRRWGHYDTYRLTRNEAGWLVRALAFTGQCDRAGEPLLFNSLRHDFIQYPCGLGYWMEGLWQAAQDRGLSVQEVQAALNELAEWINATERSAPTTGVWEGVA